MPWQKIVFAGCTVSLLFLCPLATAVGVVSPPTPPEPIKLYQWVDNPLQESARVHDAGERLAQAIHDPEYLLHHWINLPTSPASRTIKRHYLTLREAILLALRYNPNIQNAELDRIIQRYQLRLAHNEFEVQYALAGTALLENNRYTGVGSASKKTYLATPDVNLKTKLGTQLSLSMDNNVASYGGYNQLLNLTLKQPLLRGFGKAANEAGLLNAIDSDGLNKLNLQQSVMDQINQVILAYRSLILSGNNLQNQRRQLEEAKKSFEINNKKIAAGQLESTGNVQQSYQIESLGLMVEQAENEFTTSAQNLLQTIGLDPDMHLAVPSDVTVEKTPIPTVAEAVKLALEHNTTYLALTVALRTDERAYKVAKNQQLWQLDASANMQTGTLSDVDSSTGANRIYNGRNISKSAGLTLTIPLRDLNSRNQLITAKVQLEKDRLNVIAAKRALITEIKNTINTLHSQEKQYELALRQTDLAERSYRLERKKQAAGISSALDVNNTQNQLILAQANLISAKINYLNQLSNLQRTLGTTLQTWHINLRYGKE